MQPRIYLDYNNTAKILYISRFIYFLLKHWPSSVKHGRVDCLFLRLLTAWAAWWFQSFPLSLSPCYQSFGSLLALLLMHKPTALHRDPLQSAARFITGCIGCCSCLDALIGQRSSTPEQPAGKDTVPCDPTPRRLWEKNCVVRLLRMLLCC